jgi:peptide/nickel transport system substrate-binding protein
MLERIGLKVSFDVLTHHEFLRRFYMPILEKPPEEQDWDIAIAYCQDWCGHTGPSFFTFGFIEESDMRWIEYDPVYEKMWRDMARTVDPKAQEGRIRRMVAYVYELAYPPFIYSPISLYAVNKEVNFVPRKSLFLNLKEASVTDKHWSVKGEKK